MTDEAGALRLRYGSETFVIRKDPDHPGCWHYSWVSGPSPGYGFTQARSDGLPPTPTDLQAAVRGFLSSINPETGYLD